MQIIHKIYLYLIYNKMSVLLDNEDKNFIF